MKYKTLSEHYAEKFGCKVYKLSIDTGFTCPNRDGTKGDRGCIFCSALGGGEFAAREGSIKEQLEAAKCRVEAKNKSGKYIAYFQAFTNTYASIDRLRKLYSEAIGPDYIVGLSVATRPDCLSPEILDLLSRLNQRKPVWVELGLQTIHETSANFIRRGYTLDVFEKAVYDLKKIGISVIVHTILYLPHETEDMMIETISYLNRLPIDGIKLQLLHILKGTDLADIYAKSPFHLPTMGEYFILLGKLLSRLRSDIVVHRLTGDGPKNLLLAPQWTGNKRLVLNAMQKYLKDADIWQGKEFSCQNHLHSIN